MRGKRLLLVIDNCEHLLDACAILASTLLRACPELHLLATSRQALGVVGEVRMPVPPMSLPVDGAQPSAESLANSEAVRLLSERAAAVVPGFAINDENAEPVLQLCRRLDGIPLALELAAVRLGALSLDQLNEGLAGSLSALGSGNRGAEARQQTLEATIDWSYGLLDDAEQLLWARLSVFAGGFDAAAAVDVCADDRVPQEQVVELLGSLVEKSIVRRELKSGNAPRYWLLETIRQYGRERLRDLGEELRLQDRHLAGSTGLARSVGAFDDRQAELFRRMDLERDNLWAALEFCAREPDAAPHRRRTSPSISSRTGPPADSSVTCGGCSTSLASQTAEDSAARAHYLRAAAVMANSQNDVDARESLARESLRVATASDDTEAMALSLAWLSIPLAMSGNLTEAVELAESSLALARTLAELAEPGGRDGRPLQHPADGRSARTGDRHSVRRASGSARREASCGHAATCSGRPHKCTGGGRPTARRGPGASRRCDQACRSTTGPDSSFCSRPSPGWQPRVVPIERAAMLLGSAEHVRKATGLEVPDAQRQQHERSIALALEGLGQRPYDVSYERGFTMTIEDAVAFAVEDRLPLPASRRPSRPRPRSASRNASWRSHASSRRR